ncbi:heavy-metal-associated domain-containing protein [Parafrigoribacterium mesophilum]|uniref:heavy-metal-associated domain-containing protein n=1 Tax=Parafrigoribacterium mesophilum TaxID=433646 RepID=UPI0031FC1752
MDTSSERIITTYGVAGMTCDHCVASVKQEVGRVTGVDDVRVQLVPGNISMVTVTSTGPLDAGELAAAIDEAGYELVALR